MQKKARNRTLHSVNIAHGFSLPELLVSLLLGSIIIASSFNLYFSTKKTEALATTVLNTQTQARNALHILRQAIEHAGYTSEPITAALKDAQFPENALFSSGQVIYVDGQDINAQTLFVRLQGDSEKPLRACNGQEIPTVAVTPLTISYQFYVESNTLFCQVYANGTETEPPIPITNDVAALRLRLFTQNVTTASPITHIRTDSSEMGVDEKIEGIHIQLVTRSREETKTENTMTIIPITGFEDLEFDDKHYYLNSNRFFLAENQ